MRVEGIDQVSGFIEHANGIQFRLEDVKPVLNPVDLVEFGFQASGEEFEGVSCSAFEGESIDLTFADLVSSFGDIPVIPVMRNPVGGEWKQEMGSPRFKEIHPMHGSNE